MEIVFDAPSGEGMVESPVEARVLNLDLDSDSDSVLSCCGVGDGRAESGGDVIDELA